MIYGGGCIEIWKPIDNYEGLYEISNLGNVRSLLRDKLLSPKVNCRTGYVEVNLYKRGLPPKTMRVHRLVAQSFIPCEDHTLEVNHIDENKLNNNVCNLEWCDRSYNTHYGNRGKKIGEANKKRRKISQEDIEKIKYLRDNNTQVREIEQMFGISTSHIYKVTECEKRGELV